MSKLKQAAKGQACQVRLLGVCNHNPATVVLAHYRLADTCGMGMKPPDYLGAWACSACHDEIDRRTRYIDDEPTVQAAFAEGVMRTLVQLEKMGLLGVDAKDHSH